MSDPTDASWWWGGSSYNPDPNAAKLQGGAQTAQNYIGQALGGVQGRQAPQATYTTFGPAAQLNTGIYNQDRAQQMGLANTLGAIASGQQAGAGELAVNRQIGQALAQQQSAVNSARGASAMLGAREAARQSAGLGVTGAGLGQQAAMQDQANARQLQAGVLGSLAGQDLGVAGQNAGFAQQTGLAQGQANQQTTLSNLAAQMQQRGMNDQQTMAYLSQLTGMSTAELQARMQQEAVQAGSYQQGFAGSALNAAGGLATGLGALGWKPLS